MKESLDKRLGTLFDERLSNPVVSSFIISWCGWNYKFFIVLFSSNTVSGTLQLIDKVLYPTWMYYVFQGFLLPFGSVVLYFWLVPIFTKKYYHWTANARKAQDEAMYEAEKHKRLSPSDSAELQDTVRRTQAELDIETTKIERLKAELRNAANQDTERLNSIASLQTALQAEKTDAEQLRASIAERAAAEATARKERNTTARVAAFKVAMRLNEREITALTAIADSNSGLVAAAETGTAMPDLSKTEATLALDALEQKALVIQGLDSRLGIIYTITEAGVDALINRAAIDAANSFPIDSSDDFGATNTAPFRQAAQNLTELEARILEVASASPAKSTAVTGLETHITGYDNLQVALALKHLAARNYVEIRQGLPGGTVVISSLGSAIHKERKRLNP